MFLLHRISDRFKRNWQTRKNHHRIAEISASVQARIVDSTKKPVIFFNASTRLEGLSLNAAYSLLTSFGVQLSGTPVVHFVCQAGLSRCVLGTNRLNILQNPPCELCKKNSKGIYQNQKTCWFSFNLNQELEKRIQPLDLNDLTSFEYHDIPLGQLILPSLRWILRRHNLIDDVNTCRIARDYILSGWSIVEEFNKCLSNFNPCAVVVFNGMFYPESIVRWTALRHDIPVFTHEVGMSPFSVFFTSGDATAYPVEIPSDFQLSKLQEKRLDDYLTQRFQGDFLTAGIRFWPEMHEVDDAFWETAAKFKQFVPIFTNVVFDTSQSHANQVFPHMFAWLDLVLEEICRKPDTLFVIRAHPDELRPGKESNESVADWVIKNKVTDLHNVIFIGSNEFVSSYQLIERAKFVMVYNSTVGLESTILGKPVLCAGKARYTQIPIVEFPQSIESYRQTLNHFLNDSSLQIPQENIRNARHILYSQLFMASLPFNDFIESDGIWNGFVQIKDFPVERLEPSNSQTIKTIVDGILNNGDFLLEA